MTDKVKTAVYVTSFWAHELLEPDLRKILGIPKSAFYSDLRIVTYFVFCDPVCIKLHHCLFTNNY